ncbi:hypothetical protein FT663_01318 [Candidozyma haemuli var. vulneris]|uniref:Aldehyde dehydrogenase domain-containing protein n=1 Tax=Candidozyma haemuli TaxID=45357 RepID=A0A2V1AZF9_9ASCO|nr:hypothetical protein CXQ85_002472 [[Candida] haemuloni]KAF3993907.1 hypothetical protein FT662_00355 [[Candida] haemuloni var. vulneris]KAF3994518.1 hypothetical protein FT663_01318 [[Candida] haemuloni var. vulneris]PVH22753.1 hypothetical protein CXQ85_002472 [[Candida] haemuloni]
MSLPLEYPVTLPNGLKFDQPSGLFINNEFVKPQKGKVLDSINPSTGEINGSVYAAEKEDVDVAVKAARTAFGKWKYVSGAKRGGLLYKFASLIERDVELINAIEAWDSGKNKDSNARFDVAEFINVFKYYAGWADKITGKVIQNDPRKLAYTVHEPFGVCGQIIPWNFPLLMAAWKLAPALAAGNVVVLKTSEITPLSLLFVSKYFKEAGFPPGVVNIISGYGATAGSALASHNDVDKIAFTGSTATGKIITQLASSNMKAVTLELGGKSPLIIRQDAELDQAVKWSAIGVMSNQGQICSATSRILVHESVHDEFVKQFVSHVKEAYKQGDVFEKGVVVGPQVSQVQYDKVLGYIDIGKKEGAKVALGGEANKDAGKGFFIKPTILTDVQHSYRVAREEIFGPVVTVIKYSTDEEAVEIANSTEYGLGAAVFTTNIVKAHQMAADIQSGMVWINSSNDADVHIPFGGVKLSGNGRELGEYGLTTYTQAKAVHVNIGTRL